MQDLQHDIHQAFAGVRLGSGVSLHQARAHDHYEPPEVCEAARTFDTEDDWDDVPDFKLLKFSDVHPFLDPQGFRFYLPAFMRWTLRHLRDDQRRYNGPFLYSLLLHDQLDETNRGSRLANFQSLTPAQAQVVAQFLSAMAAFRDDAQEALDCYWHQFLEPAPPAPRKHHGRSA